MEVINWYDRKRRLSINLNAWVSYKDKESKLLDSINKIAKDNKVETDVVMKIQWLRKL